MNSKKTSTDTPEKILIIRLSSIGDILLSTPVIRQIRATYPNAKIDFIVKDIYEDLLKYNLHINDLYTLKLSKGHKKLNELKIKLREKSYNIVFDFHNNLRSNYLKHGIRAGKIYTIKKEKLKQTFLVRFKINLYKHEIPIPDRYLSVAKDISVTDDGNGLELHWKKKTLESAEEKLVSMGLNLNHRFICLAPGAGFFYKTLA